MARGQQDYNIFIIADADRGCYIQVALSPWSCETMALWPDRVLLLDTWDRVLLWKGQEFCRRLHYPCGDEVTSPEGEP